MLTSLVTKVKNLIKYAVIKSLDDSGNIQKIVSKGLNKNQNAALITPYGVVSVPPNDTLVVLLALLAQESNAVGVAFNSKDRTKDLPPGTTGVENYISKATILLDPGGDIKITTTAKVIINATDVAVSGNVKASGSIEGTPGVNLVTHIHPVLGPVTGEPQ